MSDAAGHVTFHKDGLVKYFIYHGTSDVSVPMLYDTEEDAWEDQRSFKVCTCGNDEDVTLTSYYGGNMDWEGRACRECMAMTENSRDPYDDGNEYDPWRDL